MNDQDYIEGREVEYQEKAEARTAENYSYINRDLDELAEVEAQLDLLVLSKKEMINSVIPFVVRQHMDDIEVEFASKIAVTEANIAQLREHIRQDVLELGSTVKGEFIMAVWTKARTSWDTKALNGYAAAHPSLNDLRKTGKPSVTIRVVK